MFSCMRGSPERVSGRMKKIEKRRLTVEGRRPYIAHHLAGRGGRNQLTDCPVSADLLRTEALIAGRIRKESARYGFCAKRVRRRTLFDMKITQRVHCQAMKFAMLQRLMRLGRKAKKGA